MGQGFEGGWVVGRLLGLNLISNAGRVDGSP